MPEPRGQKLWAVLLVVDSFFVIIFGGALGAKLYQHWQAPAASAAPQRGRRPAKQPNPEPAKAAPEPAPAPTPAPAPEPAQPKPVANAPRPPKPSLLHEAPVRETAKPQSALAPKALPTEFQLKSPGAKTVELVGAFIVRGGKKSMSAHPDGTWTITLYLTPDTYRYWFLVNGKKTLDPRSAKIERGASVISVAAP